MSFNLDTRRVNLLDCFLDRFRWYRRLRGGKWELWYVDHPICSDIWHPVTDFSRDCGERPGTLCRGTPTEESYP